MSDPCLEIKKKKFLYFLKIELSSCKNARIARKTLYYLQSISMQLEKLEVKKFSNKITIFMDYSSMDI